MVASYVRFKPLGVRAFSIDIDIMRFTVLVPTSASGSRLRFMGERDTESGLDVSMCLGVSVLLSLRGSRHFLSLRGVTNDVFWGSSTTGDNRGREDDVPEVDGFLAGRVGR